MPDDDEVPEVEVTSDLEPVVEKITVRRSGAKNVSDPRLQNAFIDEARFAMGQPSEALVRSLAGKRVTLIFNYERAPVNGVITGIVKHPTAACVVLDDDDDKVYPINSIQEIEVD